MGNHEGANTRLRASDASRRDKTSTSFNLLSSHAFTLRNWPVSWRLFAVFMLTLAMGLVFGGLRVAAAADSAAQFSRVSQLASLGQQVTVLTQALRGRTRRDVREPSCQQSRGPPALVRRDGRGGGQGPAAGRRHRRFLPGGHQGESGRRALRDRQPRQLRDAAQTSTSALLVIADYSVPINAMMALNGQIAQGADDPALTNDVQTLNSLSLEKDQVAQQRAILFNAFTKRSFANAEQQALTTAVAGQSAAATAFDATATPAEQSSFTRVVAGPLVKQAVDIEQYVVSTGSLDIGTAGRPEHQREGRAWPVVYGDVRHDQQDADCRAGGSQEPRRAGPGPAAGRGAGRAVHSESWRRRS